MYIQMGEIRDAVQTKRPLAATAVNPNYGFLMGDMAQRGCCARGWCLCVASKFLAPDQKWCAEVADY